ncbi:MAG: NFACT family protein [Firmicutes bacterium]|nr:NFACT family protein [Bacillota bacterium]
MSYDGVVTMAAARELRQELLMGKIEKIYQPQPEQILLSIHTKRGRRLLLLSAAGNHSAAYLVEKMTENPLTPPVFCMVLRKHLGAARIVEIAQHDTERILEFSLETVDELGFSVNRKLIVEIMGKHSNILLVDTGKDRIIDSIKHISIDVNRVRQILPGKAYTYPPVQQKIPFSQVTAEQIEGMISNDFQPERDLLDGIQGISPPLAQTIASAGFGGDQQQGGSFDASLAFAHLRGIVDSLEDGSLRPAVYLKEDGRPADFHITPLSVYENDPTYRVLPFPSLSQAAEWFFAHRDSTNVVRQRSADLQRVIKATLDKLKLKLQRLEEDRQKAENADRYRLYGELLTANLHLVEPGADKVTVTSYYDGSQVSIPLDPRFSPARNAQRYYKKYGKARTAIKEKAIQIEETQREIDYLESVLTFAENAATIEETDLLRQELTENGFLRRRAKDARRQTKKNPRPQPRRYALSSGREVLVGRNNRENDWLTCRRAAGNDMWLHTKDIPGSHVILLLEGGQPTEEELFEAAGIAAFHSKGKSSSNVPVDYTLVRHVKKPAGARPGMVIFTHNKTLYVEPALPPGAEEVR